MNLFDGVDTTAEQVVERVAGLVLEVLGDSKRPIKGVAALELARPEHLAFCSARGEEGHRKITGSSAGTVICTGDIPGLPEMSLQKTFLVVKDPLLCFARYVKAVFAGEEGSGVHGSALVGRDCEIHPEASIGPNVVIGDRVQIGRGSRIESGVRIYSGVRIGRQVRVWANSTLGSDGLAYATDEGGGFERLPHLGSVNIGDEVDIGANTCIVRGILQETTIGKGTKIGNQVNIGHNVQVGSRCFISAGAVLCGSAVVEDGCWIAPHACIRNHVRVGARATVGLGAVVLQDVPENKTVVGNPARILE